eukprot:gene2088-1269_t
MAKGTVKRKPTPSAKRQKKARQRVRKHIKAKREKKRPKWEAAVAKVYDPNPRQERTGSGGLATTGKEKKRPRAGAEAGNEDGSNGKRKRRDSGAAASTLSFLSPEEEAAEAAAMDEDLEVESDVDEEKEERMNQKNPLETQLFFKGLPLDTSEEEVTTFLRSHFGKVKRGLADAIFEHAQKNAREVAAMDRDELKKQTEHLSRHQAKRLAHKLRTDSFTAQDPFLTLRGVKFTVHRPMKRTEAQETLSAAEKKKKKRTKVAADDPRHLYLLQEGLITPESPAARDLPRPYLMAIWKAYEARKEQLKNTNYFVSTTRLNVRNLPRTLTENDLRRLFAKHARKYLQKHPEDLEQEKWGKYGPIKNVKLVRDTDGQVKGYGFLEFVNHNVALHCLRMINNNPTIFGDKRRLIVSFAVENIAAIQKLKRIKELKRQRAKDWWNTDTNGLRLTDTYLTVVNGRWSTQRTHGEVYRLFTIMNG